MNEKRLNALRRIYGAVLSTVIVIAGICLIAACLSIYRSGPNPYSREAVAEAFSMIAVPVYLCLAMVIAGFLLDLFLPGSAKKAAPGRQLHLILGRLQAKADLENCGDALRRGILGQRQRRRLHKTVTAGLLLMGSVIFLCYGLNGSHFHPSDMNGSMIRAMLILLPCMAVPFGYAVFAAYDAQKSMQREIELLKQAPSRTDAPSPAVHQRKDPLPMARTCFIVLGIGLLLYGLFTGGTADVLTKAINICTECVGLG